MVSKRVQLKSSVFDRKRIVRVLGFPLTIALTACFSAPENARQSEISSLALSLKIEAESLPSQIVASPEIKATRPWKFAIAVKDSLESEGWSQVWQAAREAADDFGVEVVLLTNPCQTCVTEQIQEIDTLIRSQQIDGLIIGVVDSIALTPVVEKAIQQGIPTIAIDTPLNSEMLVTSVGFDNFAGGKAIGEWVVKQLGDRGQVAILTGPIDHQNASDRHKGFLSGLQAGNIEIVATEAGNWETGLAREITARWLERYPKLDAIVAANDNMALGASQAARAVKVPLLITGFDATDFALNAIAEGQMGATISQEFHHQSRLSIQLLIRHLEQKETFPPFVAVSDISLITRDNIGGD
ncbi:MAG: sugar ABC transporter substrate-binding protein [Cyanobacteria bacterium SBLK]|nr:sugar ABC transporter substrate-binding protein [Cyanobacteria bacterium SBLK]